MIRVRIAPSPTGVAHVGTAYAALFNYAFAKQKRGKFVLRIEDTDVKRSQVEFEKIIFDGLHWLNLSWDEGPDIGGELGPYRQSERKDIYQEWVKKLLEKKLAYEKEGAIYLKAPTNQDVSWKDLIRGEVSFPKETLKDFVIQKSDGFPVYNFAVVIDDYLMKISHVIRAEEHISNTPRQILIYQALGWQEPQFAHLPLLRNSDRSKISKRKNPVALDWYQKEGYLPEAVVNFLCLLGWSHPKEKDVFEIKEFIEHFSFARISKSAPIFDFNKLNWLNGAWIRKTDDQKLARLLLPFLPEAWRDETLSNQIVPLIKERIKTLKEAKELIDFFFEEVKAGVGVLVQKGKTKGETKRIISNFQFLISKLKSKDWEKDNLERICREMMEKTGWSAKDFFMTLRGALTGKTVTPPLLESMAILGKEKTLQRLQKAIEILS